MSVTTETDLAEQFTTFYRRYYGDEVATLAQHYPNEQQSLVIQYDDLFQYDADLAEDWLRKPEEMQEHAEEGLRLYDLPVDVTLSRAHVRLAGVPIDNTAYPGGFSPTERAGEYFAVEGQVAKVTEVYSQIVEAAFECQRCGTMTYILQSDNGFEEPHECQGCERQGPFHVDFDQSEFVDGQKLRLEEPPEVAKGGNSSHLDVFIEDDLTEIVDPGDKAVVTGTLHLEQQSSNNQKTAKFEPYMTGGAVERKETEFEDINITDEDVEKFREIAPDIFDLATDSVAPQVVDEDDVKLAIFLQLVSGVRTEMPDGTFERGDFHQLLIGDPSTAKSQLMDAAEELAPRSVSVSGHGASASGLTAAAVRDDFGDGQWTLEAGALVHAHKGLACVDELDKINEDAKNSMHKALAQQRVPVNKAGINATLPSETSMLAAANPKHGRWDKYSESHEQIDIDSALLSRFGLVWKFTDEPDAERDPVISDAVLASKDVAKRLKMQGQTVTDEERRDVEPALDAEFLRTYIAYVRTNFSPVFRDESVREKARENFVSLRGANGYSGDAAVPVTFRKLQDVHRLAEASARARQSNVIEEQDVNRAQELVGASMRQFQTNSDGDLDADIVESGTSMPQKQRIQRLRELIAELQPNDGGALTIDALCEAADEELGLSERMVKDTVDSMSEKGELYHPNADDGVRVFSS